MTPWSSRHLQRAPVFTGAVDIEVAAELSKQDDVHGTVYDAQKFGAVVYVLPHSGRLTFRLRPEDVADLDNEDIVERNVVATQKYAVRYMLDDDSKLEAARSLTERALKIVRE